MRNEWLEDFRLELYNLGRSIWDYQEGTPGSVFELHYELKRVAKQVVVEYGPNNIMDITRERLIKGCILYMTKQDSMKLANGQEEFVEGTSLIEKLDLTKQDSFAYCVKHMAEYLRDTV